MNKAYSSFPEWSDLSEIKQLEVDERDNSWFDDSNLDLNLYIAKWVCLDPLDALYYCFEADFFKLNPNIDLKPDHVLESRWELFKTAYNNPLDYVSIIDLTGAEKVHEDPDGGFLYIKRK